MRNNVFAALPTRMNLAAFTLGQLLDAVNALPMVAFMQGVPSDASGIVARQREAVALLRKSGMWAARLGLAQALSKLSALFADPRVGDSDQGNAVRSDAIEAWRGLVGKVPGAEFQLVLLLCDQAGSWRSFVPERRSILLVRRSQRPRVFLNLGTPAWLAWPRQISQEPC